MAEGPAIQWQKTFGGPSADVARSVQQTSDGGYIIVGWTESYGAGSRDVYLIKTDAAGNMKWQKTFGGSGYDDGFSVQQTSDGGYIVVGYTASFGYMSDVYLIKTDSEGDLVWQKPIGGTEAEEGRSIQETPDGGYIIIGYTCSYGTGGGVDTCGDVWLVKSDSGGNVDWHQTWGGSGTDGGNGGGLTSDGGYIIAAGTHSFGAGGWDAWLIKTDSSGKEQWKKTFGGSSDDGCSSVQQTSDGGYILTGSTHSFGAGDPYGNLYLIRTDSAGNTVWENNFGGNASDVGVSAHQTPDGGYIAAGWTRSFGTGDPYGDVYLVRTDSAGNMLWQTTFGGSSSDAATSFQPTSDGGYIIAGSTRSYGAGNDDVYLLKIAPTEYPANIKLKRFETNQCFQQVDPNDPNGTKQVYELIETKPFVVRVNLEREFPGSTSAKVKLSVVNAKTDERIGKPPVKEQKGVIIEYGSSKEVDFLFNDDETRNMKAGDYTFSLVVEDNEKKGTELLESNLTYQFKSSKTVRMLVIPVLLYNLVQIGVWNPNYVDFTQQVFPVPKTHITDVNHFEVVYAPLQYGAGTGTLQELPFYLLYLLPLRLNVLLSLYNINNPESPADFICAVVSANSLYPQEGYCIGRAVVIEADYSVQSALGHEIGHLFGLGEEYVQSAPKVVGSSALWVLKQRFEFCNNPPPLELSENGEFLIDHPHSIYSGKKCKKILDQNSCAKFEEISRDDEGNPLRDIWGNLVSYMECRGRYVRKGGYDVVNRTDTEKSPQSILSMMSMASSYKWISGPEYKSLIDYWVLDKCTPEEYRLSAYSTAVLNGQARMIVSGLVDIDNRTAELSPLIPVLNLNPTPEVAESDLTFAFLSKVGTDLGAFKFAPMESEYIGEQRPFCVIVDLPVGTAVIQVTISGTIGTELRLTDNSPAVSVLSPNGGEEIIGQMPISWSASDTDGDKLKYAVEFSNDKGAKWNTLTIDHNETELTVDANYLPGGPNCLVKVIASDGWNRSEDTSDAPFSIATKPPRVSILEPANGTILLATTNMQGRCSAYDPETGDITDPNKIVWSSNVDGFLGKGNLVGFKLTLGDHLLSATVTDSEGKTGTGTIKVSVAAKRSDVNRDLSIDVLDLDMLVSKWLLACSEPNWCEGTDLNFSGKIDFDDFAIFAENWLWKKITADLDIDDNVALTDYATLASYWMNENCDKTGWCHGTDLDKSGMVDILDLAILAEHWLEGTMP